MKLETTKNVTYVDATKLTAGGTKSGIVQIEIIGYNLIVNKTRKMVEVSFAYTDEDGNDIPSQYNNKFVLLDEDLITMSENIQSSLAPTTNIVDKFSEEVLHVAKLQMVETFNIELSDIAVVNEED